MSLKRFVNFSMWTKTDGIREQIVREFEREREIEGCKANDTQSVIKQKI